MKRNIAVAVLLFASALLFAGCGKSKYPNPSKDYYVSDFANALLPGTRSSFVGEGERLYKLTKKTELGGSQIVVATMLAKSQEQADGIDRTELYRKWRIGQNDMGLLILLIFMEDEQDPDILNLISSQIEIGYRMEQFVTAARAAYVLDYCLYNPEWDGSIDMGLGEMYYELLSTIYVDAYGYDSFDYDMEAFREHLLYSESATQTEVPMSFFVFLLSPYSPLWYKVIAGAAMFLLPIGGGAGFFTRRNRGGGGKSGGYGKTR